jgi:hypothetical protein
MIRTGPISFLLPLAFVILGALTVSARGTEPAQRKQRRPPQLGRQHGLAEPTRRHPDIGSHTTSSGESND